MTGQRQNYNYDVIARALREIDAGGPALTPDDLVTRMGMSKVYFQQVFMQWLGVPPKRCKQDMILDHAWRFLVEPLTALETVPTAGLSKGGRSHDLFLRWSAMNPDEYTRGGEGLVIRQGWFETPFGKTVVMGTECGICGMGFAAEMGEAEAVLDLRRRWPQATFVEDTALLEPWIGAAFGGGEDVPLYLIGTPFQIKVWETLLRVQSGYVTSYSQLAEAVGMPKAVRAVATAVGRNPVSFLIPCHRVLRKSGALGGYHWGLSVKRAILAWEAVRTQM
ncbi:MAG: methylated-DNA--[protein]-cysteine S-methyltransferase [Rhodobacteraceae bacterium]|nr:methylated-DNA--[protein]-cysteine S-methyltransferase [Paracoccaceae bacterium]